MSDIKFLDETGLKVIDKLAKKTFPIKGSADFAEAIENAGDYNMIERNTKYKVGDILYSKKLPIGYVLQCIEPGTTGKNEP